MASSTADSDDSTERSEEVHSGGVEEVESRVGLRYTLAQIKRDPTALVGLFIIGVMTAIAVFTWVDANLLNFWFAETYWTDPQTSQGGVQTLQPPFFAKGGSMEYPLGTDHRGRGVLVRLFYGTRVTMQVGYISTIVGFFGGTVVGAVAGYYGGWIDDVLMRAVETLYAIPFLIFIITFQEAFGESLLFAMLGVGIISIPTFARLIRSRVLSVREEDYIEAARAAGVKDRNVIFRHVIPNSFAPVLVQATLQIGTAIILVAGLSFLGYGAQPPKADWGKMLNNARFYMLPAPWFSVWPGLCILLTVIGFNILGDGLRDALDPRVNN